MSVTLLAVGAVVMAMLAPLPKPRPGHAAMDGLSLVVTLDKKKYGPDDEIALRFALRNVSGKTLYVGDGFLAPAYNEAGPGRHFEVHVKAGGKKPLYFWSGMATEGKTSGIRKVFLLEAGEEYKGAIRLTAGVEKDRKRASISHELWGGSFEDVAKRKAHVLGKDDRSYTVELRYQVNPKLHGTWNPPKGYKDALLWKGELTTAPLKFDVDGK